MEKKGYEYEKLYKSLSTIKGYKEFMKVRKRRAFKRQFYTLVPYFILWTITISLYNFTNKWVNGLAILFISADIFCSVINIYKTFKEVPCFIMKGTLQDIRGEKTSILGQDLIEYQYLVQNEEGPKEGDREHWGRCVYYSIDGEEKHHDYGDPVFLFTIRGEGDYIVKITE